MWGGSLHCRLGTQPSIRKPPCASDVGTCSLNSLSQCCVRAAVGCVLRCFQMVLLCPCPFSGVHTFSSSASGVCSFQPIPAQSSPHPLLCPTSLRPKEASCAHVWAHYHYHIPLF